MVCSLCVCVCVCVCVCHRSGMTMCARHITRIGERKKAFKVLVGKHGRRRLGRHRHRWKGGI